LCRECGRPLWDGYHSSLKCEACLDRTAAYRYAIDWEREQLFNPGLSRRKPGEVTERTLSDIERGY
jgi:hypothetical protein